MGKLTGRTAISTNIDENLLIHVVDTTGTPASYKATLSQLYAVFPKNSSAGSGDVDYLARWTASNELGKGIVQDNGSQATINGKTIIKNSGLTSQLEIHKTGSSLIYFYDDAGSAIQSYIGDATVSTTADTFRIFHQGSVGLDIDSSHNVDIPNGNLDVNGTITSTSASDAKLKLYTASGQNNNRIEYLTSAGATRSYIGYSGASSFLYYHDTDSVEIRGGTMLFNSSGIVTIESGGTNAIVANTSQNVSIPNGYFSVSGDESYPVRIQNDRQNTAYTFVDSTGASVRATMGYGQVSSTNSFNINNSENSPLRIYTNSVESIKIETTGDVGIPNGNLEVDGQAYSTIQSSVYQPTTAFTIDWDLGNVAIVNLNLASGTIQVGFSNQKAGANYFIKIIQHPTSAVSLTFPTSGAGAVKWPSGTAPTISTGASAVDGVALTCISSGELLGNFSQDYQ